MAEVEEEAEAGKRELVGNSNYENKTRRVAGGVDALPTIPTITSSTHLRVVCYSCRIQVSRLSIFWAKGSSRERVHGSSPRSTVSIVFIVMEQLENKQDASTRFPTRRFESGICKEEKIETGADNFEISSLTRKTH